MNIHTISKENKNVTVELTADDLVAICNAFLVLIGNRLVIDKNLYQFARS